MQQAADALGVPRRRISELIKRGELHTETNPLDQRSRLIPETEIEKLAALPRAPRRHRAADSSRATADQVDAVSVATDSRPRPRSFDLDVYEPTLRSDEIDEHLREHWQSA